MQEPVHPIWTMYEQQQQNPNALGKIKKKSYICSAWKAITILMTVYSSFMWDYLSLKNNID